MFTRYKDIPRGAYRLTNYPEAQWSSVLSTFTPRTYQWVIAALLTVLPAATAIIIAMSFDSGLALIPAFVASAVVWGAADSYIENTIS